MILQKKCGYSGKATDAMILQKKMKFQNKSCKNQCENEIERADEVLEVTKKESRNPKHGGLLAKLWLGKKIPEDSLSSKHYRSRRCTNGNNQESSWLLDYLKQWINHDSQMIDRRSFPLASAFVLAGIMLATMSLRQVISASFSICIGWDHARNNVSKASTKRPVPFTPFDCLGWPCFGYSSICQSQWKEIL